MNKTTITDPMALRGLDILERNSYEVRVISPSEIRYQPIETGSKWYEVTETDLATLAEAIENDPANGYDLWSMDHGVVVEDGADQ